MLLTKGGKLDPKTMLGAQDSHWRMTHTLDDKGNEFTVTDNDGLKWKVGTKGAGLVAKTFGETSGFVVEPWFFQGGTRTTPDDMRGLMWLESGRHSYAMQKLIEAKGVRTYISLMVAEPLEYEKHGKMVPLTQADAEGFKRIEDHEYPKEEQYALRKGAQNKTAFEMRAVRTNVRVGQISST